jgi:mannose-6-phosphate isomerase-like protein (cupin superfamily)
VAEADRAGERLFRQVDDVSPQTWDDPVRGLISFRTLFASEETGTAGLTTGVAELRPGGRLELHRHSATEIYYVLEGHGVTSVDGRTMPVGTGSSVFIPGGAWHGIRNTGAAALRFIYTLAADGMADVHYDFGPGEPGPQGQSAPGGRRRTDL